MFALRIGRPVKLFCNVFVFWDIVSRSVAWDLNYKLKIRFKNQMSSEVRRILSYVQI